MLLFIKFLFSWIHICALRPHEQRGVSRDCSMDDDMPPTIIVNEAACEFLYSSGWHGSAVQIRRADIAEAVFGFWRQNAHRRSADYIQALQL